MPAPFVAKWTAIATPARCWTTAAVISIRSIWRLAKRTPFRLNGGRVYEQSPVTGIQHSSPAVVTTARGQVTARYVIVAGNALSR